MALRRKKMGDGGYAAVDAMVAMLIVSLAVVLSFRAVQTASEAASQAQELRQIEATLASVMLDGPRQFDAAIGANGALTWTLETEVTGAERPIALCRRVVSVDSTATARRYRAATLETCPPTEPS